MSSSWSSNLGRILRPPIRIERHCPRQYPENTIWKRAAVRAINQDLLEGRHGRRLMRIDDLGLGGFVMYEIGRDLDWEAVFGKVGMSVEELLDTIQAQVVYAPLYACSSFVIGQMMNAALRDATQSVPGAGGLCILPAAFFTHEDGKDDDDESVVEAILRESDSDSTLNEEPSLILDDDDSVYSVEPLTPVKGNSNLPFMLNSFGFELGAFEMVQLKDSAHGELDEGDVFFLGTR